MQTINFPSVTVVGSADRGQLSLGVFGRGHALPRPYCLVFSDGVCQVGLGAELCGRPTERQDFARLAEGPELRALSYTALGQLLGPGAHTLAVTVGYPVEVLADKELAKTLLRLLRAWLVGEHTFTLDGQDYHLYITAVNVLAQPAGAYFAWGLDDTGHWYRPAADLQAQVAIADLGFNTLDLFTVQAGQIIARYTDGDTLGMRRAAELIVTAVKREYGVSLSLHQADALLRERQPALLSAGQTHDLTPIVQPARESAAGTILTFLESHWGNGRQFGYVLLTGGGALALQDTLLRQFPHAVLLPDPVTANAVGLTRYARRAFQDAPLVVGLDPGFGSFKAGCLKR